MTYCPSKFDEILNDMGHLLRCALKMTLLHHFTYVLFHTYSKIMKLMSLKTGLNNVPETKRNHPKRRSNVKLTAKMG